LVLAPLSGCVSVEKRYRRGQELESQGRLEEAAQRYIAVLAKEPDREDARQRLVDVGSKVVDDYLKEARANEADGYFDSAVAAILRIDGLRGRTEQVGVALEVPEDYADFRRDTVDAAVGLLFRQGEGLEGAGKWAEALQRFERMAPYPLAPEQRRRVDEARGRVLLRWAGEDMEKGSFRAAYERAQNVLNIAGPDSAAGEEARSLQKAALDAGTMTVAVLPFWVDPAAGDRTPRGIEGRLYDALLYEHMDDPVLFVGPIDRGAIHREMSRLRVRTGDITVQTASAVGRALNADFVVLGWLDSYRQEDGPPQETARQAPLRGDRSKSVTYTERRYTVKLTGEVIYRLIEPATRKVVEEDTVSAAASGQLRRAFYNGDSMTLDLDRDERALFDKETWLRAEEDLQKKLVDELAKKIAPSVFERVLRYVR
jgi:tetratricopeptide (TPR) repeat protein